MKWIQKVRDWIDPKPKPDEWKPGTIVFFRDAPPTPAASPADGPKSTDAAATAGLGSGTDGGSDPESDEKNESGDEPKVWYPCETIEGEPPNRLEHADHLPSSTFRVFPVAGNHRNTYDSEDSVRRAVAARQRSRERWESYGHTWHTPTKVYRAETVWRDVTSEYVN